MATQVERIRVGQPKLALEKQIKEIQNQIHKALDSLVLKSTNLDISDIIPIEDIRRGELTIYLIWKPLSQTFVMKVN